MRREVTQPTEEQEQVTVFQWAELMQYTHPELRLLFHIPNGGFRHKATAARMKGQGVKAGVPDLFLPVARGDWHGLFIEMKRTKGGHVAENQKAWIEQLTGQGYAAVVCQGAEDACDTLMHYLTLPGSTDRDD